MASFRVRHCLFVALLAFHAVTSTAQAAAGSAKRKTVPASIPVITEIKKTILFLDTECQHNYTDDLPTVTREKLSKMSPELQEATLANITSAIVRLNTIKISHDKLTPEEVSNFLPKITGVLSSKADLPKEIESRIQVLIRMTSFRDAELASLTDAELALIPIDHSLGTGFLIGYSDSQGKARPGDAGPPATRYLVSNRHVVQPGIEKGKPCTVLRSFILMNRKADATHTKPYAERIRVDKIFHWFMPEDESVDLAVTDMGFIANVYDQMHIPDSMFVTDEQIRNGSVVEGDPLLFAGLFVQTYDEVHTLEPIVRSGSLAMLPEGLLPTTLQNKMGRLYLADAHVFAGNSGSPVFVNPNRYSAVTGPRNYKLLGVVSGLVSENSDMTLSVTSTLSARIAGNSGVSMIVPVSELVKLLEAPQVKAARDGTAPLLSR